MMHHVRREHTTRSFMCDTCSSAFWYKSELNKHVKRVHGGGGGERLLTASTSLKRHRQTEQNDLVEDEHTQQSEQIVVVEDESHLQQAQPQLGLSNRSQDLIVFIKKIE